MKRSKKILSCVVAVAIPLAVGGISSLLTSSAMKVFGSLTQPPLSPPGWLFPVAWTILYILMGISSFLIFQSSSNANIRKRALVLYGAQLVLNFIWSPLFFNGQLYFVALVVLVVMWLLILALIVNAGKVSKSAAYLLVPYILWATFAAYLNIMIWLLN
ncbi:MAG: tryptophan-rich sensory protein [Treponema sp.]|nr:tryptophan-rich sensory protein [Treponema sp.]